MIKDISKIKPIRGSCLSLAYQDVRNKYMNPRETDMTSPELWDTKIGEMAAMGIRYLVIVAVANEGKAYYESKMMPWGYCPHKESPMSAIMKSADRHGIKIFMSSGWAFDQFDNPSKNEVREIQIKIMRETAALFSGHESFYGWYLPCEDSIAPFIPENMVNSVNILSAEARRLTPCAKVLISPYGLSLGAVIDDKFVRQLSKLDVDIIAYQDEVGCVRGPTPLETMKSMLPLLRAAHDRVQHIALWANVESFTWEGETNSGQSALVPAAFPRLLSQMTAVSPYADEVISFIFQGILDEPGSVMPLGQSEYSAKMAEDYAEYLGGRGRWPFLAASFQGRLTHEAVGRPVTLHKRPADKHSRGAFTNGRLGTADLADEEWLGFGETGLDATVDLGENMNIRTLAVRFLQYSPAGIRLPSHVEFLASDNGRDFMEVAKATPEFWPNDRHDYWIDMCVSDNLDLNVRYLRVKALNSGRWIFADEFFVNPSITGNHGS